MPIELFKTILQQVAISLGLCEAILLRLVCNTLESCCVTPSSRLTHVDILDGEIPDAIIKARLLELFAKEPRVEIGQPLLSRYLEERILADKTMKHVFSNEVQSYSQDTNARGKLRRWRPT